MPPWSALVKVTAPTETNNAAFSLLDFYGGEKKQQISLHLHGGTLKRHVQSLNVHVKPGMGEVIRLYSSSFIRPSSLITHLSFPTPIPALPSLFSQPKSNRHVRFFRNDKCCTLAVPLPTSRLSWLKTFHSCQLFHLTLTGTPRKRPGLGRRARLDCLQ